LFLYLFSLLFLSPTLGLAPFNTIFKLITTTLFTLIHFFVAGPPITIVILALLLEFTIINFFDTRKIN
jgi:hypothetical protein